MQRAVLNEKLERLRAVVEGLSPALLAVSGGLDSRLLAHLCWEWEQDVEAVFFRGVHMSPAESSWAQAWLHDRGQACHVLSFNPVSHPKVHANCRLRCYHCKSACFSRARYLARERSIPYLLDGSNVSDAEEYRPGRQALAELDVQSPLAMAGMTKDDIRAAARLVRLERPNQPSRPCLLTRLEYGIPPSEEVLARIGLAEDALCRMGLRQFRLRIMRAGAALHIARDEESTWCAIREWALARLADEGFEDIGVVFTESLSGFFDRDLHV
ncbi:PP-loop superfamily ATP-utilizing enzyme [Oceanidesulfovibrio indonesiensis]|uniref:PP-loop superfamily ATP-utilizing enzyme n=1 Tax=Oceanidesulfovibrio indonesiensis TaxID=54767 RepID=A0A7M3MBH3_9BACT|nr:PP-loop superfamily ATP-utilizing enzyme [Oceanidesulfovibrio indonesiensis]TVM15545.1 PP-loop superfamily ATP-utilizing enzyme [Oceanidesulfovibrio indonesiensis]